MLGGCTGYPGINISKDLARIRRACSHRGGGPQVGEVPEADPGEGLRGLQPPL